MPYSLQIQLRQTYFTCRGLGCTACEAYALARRSVGFSARRAAYVCAMRRAVLS